MSRNVIASLLCKGVTLVTGLVVQQHILTAFGSTYNGLTSMIAQIMSYLVLLESGLGAASIQALYKPLNDGDWNRINSIMNATATSYTRVGLMFGGMLLGGALLVPLAVAGEADFFIAGLLTLVSGGGNVISYLISAKYTAFLTAEKKMYVNFTLEGTATLMSAVLRIIALKCGCGIVVVQLMNLICVAGKSVLLAVYVRRNYKQLDKKVKPDFSAISKRWNVLVHNIAGLVVNHTHVLILSVAASLKQVSVYNVYNMIFGQMGTLLQTIFSQALQGDFGRVMSKDKDAFERLFSVYETIFTIVLFVIGTLAMVLATPFIRLYTSGVTDVNYIDIWLPVLFTAVMLMNYIRIPAILTINAAGAFKETQKGAILEAAINLVASLGLFLFTDLGMYGLLLGSVCSYLYRTTDVIVYVYRKIVKRNVFRFLRLFVVNAAVMALIWYVLCVKTELYAKGYLEWVGLAILVGIGVLLVYLVVNILFNQQDMKAVLESVRNKIRPRS